VGWEASSSSQMYSFDLRREWSAHVCVDIFFSFLVLLIRLFILLPFLFFYYFSLLDDGQNRVLQFGSSMDRWLFHVPSAGF